MSDTADLELLARYTRQHAEDDFSEVVRRHLDLVHSAALRQVRSPQLAEEVAQSTFIKLARHAHRLAPDTILTAWLYQVTRRTAIDVVRREASRQLREQIAAEINDMNAADLSRRNPMEADWTHIEPLLDEAMHALDDTDRAAILLRYFENKSLREVGATLGTSENAAQKRLGRAVERLREFFTKRGVTVGASGLVVVISTNAVQAAPVGLAVTISTAAALAGTTITATAAVTAAKTIVMTTLQKTLIAVAVIAAGVGTPLVIQHQATLKSRGTAASQTGTVQNPQAAASPKESTDFPRTAWKFSGYADPQSGFQSLMWSMSQGELTNSLESLTPTERAKWEKNTPANRTTEVAAQMARSMQNTELFRILDKRSVSDTEIVLRVQVIGRNNQDAVSEQDARMIKVGNDWKFDGWAKN